MSKTFSIAEWPIDDRPREKLLKHGEKTLSNADARSWREFKGLGDFVGLFNPLKFNKLRRFFVWGRMYQVLWWKDQARIIKEGQHTICASMRTRNGSSNCI